MNDVPGAVEEAESPAAAAEDQRDEVRRPDEGAEQDSQPADDGEPASQADGAADAADKAEKDASKPANQFLADAKALLTRKPDDQKPEAKPDATAAKPPAKAEKPATDTAKPKPKADAAKDQDKDNPFEGLPRDELKVKTRERISQIHKRAVTAETTLKERAEQWDRQTKEIEPFVKKGQDYQKIVESYNLAPHLEHVTTDAFAGAIFASAASDRAAEAIKAGFMPDAKDIEALVSVRQALDPILAAVGHGSQSQEFKGKLPDDLQALVDDQVITEERARLIAAAEKGKAPAKPVEKAQPQGLRPAAERPAPQQRKTEAATTPAADDGSKAAWDRITAICAKGGVAPAEIGKHVRDNLSPIIMRLAKEDDPKFNGDLKAILPVDRVDLARRAQLEWKAKQSASTEQTEEQPQPQSLRSSGRGAGANGSELSLRDAAVAHLSRR